MRALKINKPESWDDVIDESANGSLHHSNIFSHLQANTDGLPADKNLKPPHAARVSFFVEQPSHADDTSAEEY